MRRALDLASSNVRSGQGGPFGAVVVRGDTVIAEGTNLVTSTNDPTAHAEVVVIRKACAALKLFQLAGCDLFTSCEPCPMCLGAIYWARPAAVYYAASHTDAAAAGFDDGFIYAQLRLPVHQRQLPMRRILVEEAIQPFEIWAKYDSAIPY